MAETTSLAQFASKRYHYKNMSEKAHEKILGDLHRKLLELPEKEGVRMRKLNDFSEKLGMPPKGERLKKFIEMKTRSAVAVPKQAGKTAGGTSTAKAKIHREGGKKYAIYVTKINEKGKQFNFLVHHEVEWDGSQNRYKLKVK